MPARTTMALVLPLLICGLSACASMPLASIPQSTCQERRLDRLVFGMNSPDGPIADAQWRSFVADVVTPRFPDGLTIYEAQGQWRGASGRIEQENSRVVEIVHGDEPDGRARIAEISAEYKRRFRQEAVLLISTRAQACL